MKRLGIGAVVLATTAAITTAVFPQFYSRDGKYHSGYIDPQGQFYGCGIIEHLKLALRLCQQIGYTGINAMAHLDTLGWVKVTADGFFWDRRPNAEQKAAIVDYLIERGVAETRFNDPKHTKALWKAQMDGTL